MTDPAYDVFISHSSKNADLGSLMKEYLGSRGIRCWKAPDDIREHLTLAMSIYAYASVT